MAPHRHTDQAVAWRVILVDDHAGSRAQARALLEEEGARVVGEAAGGAEALELLARVTTDVVLLDVLLPDVDGFEVADRIAALPHPPAVVLTSTRDADAYGDRIDRVPVRGFLPKAELSVAAIDRLLGTSADRAPQRTPSLAASDERTSRRIASRSGMGHWLAGRSLSALLRLLAWPLCLLVGLASISWLAGLRLSDTTPFDAGPLIGGVALVGGSTALAGLVAWSRRSDRLVGPLLVVAALAWFVGAVSWADDTLPALYNTIPEVVHVFPAVPFNDGGAFQGYYVLALVVLVLAYPSGGLGSPATRLLVASLGAVLVAATVARVVMVAGPYFIYSDLPDPTCVSMPTMASDQATQFYDALDVAFQAVLLLGAALASAIVLGRWWRAHGPGRRVLAPALAMSVALTAGIGLALLRRQSGFDIAMPDVLRAGSVVALAVLPHAFTLDLVRGRLARTGVADLVQQLDEAPTAHGMAALLGRTLGDREVAVLVWSTEANTYLDENGRATGLPKDGPNRAATLLEHEGRRLGALVHDVALREDPGLLASVSAVVTKALENDRLQAEVRAQLTEVRASRARIVAAGDEQRARIERDLHDGAQQQLVALAIALRSARGRVDAAAQPELALTLAQASERAESAVTELRELAGGIHPAILVEAGLPAALASLARRATVPVTVEAPLAGRLPAPVEASAYFLVSEALANTSKHAHAHAAHVRTEVVGDRLRIEVADDGVGGADLARGTGLRGLADRVAALNGSLRVESPPGGGTHVVAEIPCAS
jgi:signal transduction histidine kinase/CheY-like chemotaxis protein